MRFVGRGTGGIRQRPGGPRQLRRLLRLGYRLNPIPASLGGWLAIASGVGLVLSRISWTSYIWLLPDLRF